MTRCGRMTGRGFWKLLSFVMLVLALAAAITGPTVSMGAFLVAAVAFLWMYVNEGESK